VAGECVVRLRDGRVVVLPALRLGPLVPERRLAAQPALFPYTTLFRSLAAVVARDLVALRRVVPIAREGVAAVGGGVAALRGRGGPAHRTPRLQRRSAGRRGLVPASRGRFLGHFGIVGLFALRAAGGVS